MLALYGLSLTIPVGLVFADGGHVQKMITHAREAVKHAEESLTHAERAEKPDKAKKGK